MMKLANPLHYPLAVLGGGIILVMGVRLIQLPSYVALPSAAAIATAIAVPLKQQRSQQLNLDNPALVREIRSVKQQAQLLTTKAAELRQEAQQMLTSSAQLELFAAVEYACDRVLELPSKVDRLAQKLQGADSLLSSAELTRQIAEVRTKASASSGVAQTQLNQLATSLENNLQLAQQGQDARQAQVVSLATLVTESAGVLQQFQNRLRTSDLDNSQEIDDLKAISNELKNTQNNIDLLIS
ncbi:MAG: hypothetical protein AAFR77_20405 [Cyanobacteria bacterium J06631_2]